MALAGLTVEADGSIEKSRFSSSGRFSHRDHSDIPSRITRQYVVIPQSKTDSSVSLT